MERADFMLSEIREKVKESLLQTIRNEYRTVFPNKEEVSLIALLFIETNGQLLLSDFLSNWASIRNQITYNFSGWLQAENNDGNDRLEKAYRQVVCHIVEFQMLVESVENEGK